MRTKTGFPRFLGSKIPLSQSLYWRPSADQKARGLWVRDCYPRVSTGAHPLTKKPEDSGYEIVAEDIDPATSLDTEENSSLQVSI